MKCQEITSKAFKLTIEEDGNVVARGRLYLIENDLGHSAPCGYVEDVFVEESFRGKGYGKQIAQALIEKAKEAGCYKIIATSRFGREKVHELYKRIGFQEWGKEFRLDLK